MTVDAPVPPDADLRDFPFTPLFRARLFGSSFHARATDSEWRAGLTLWLKSWDQVPAGSLPTDDIELCRLAELGRDMRTWRKLRGMALHGWEICADGRLYHSVVTEGVIEAIKRKEAQRDRTHKARVTRLQQRRSQTQSGSVTDSVTDTVTTSKGQGQGQKEDSEPKGSVSRGSTGDPIKALWDRGVRLLVNAGTTEKHARSNIGAWRKEYGNAKVSAAFSRAEDERVSDPVAYITRVLANGRTESLDPKDPRSIAGYRAPDIT